MRSVTASAPAKAILFGEHFVVKGALGVVTAIDLRARVKVTEDRGSSLTIYSRELGGKYKINLNNLESTPKPIAPFARIIKWLKERDYTIYPAIVEVKSNIPLGAGLGSSAATASAFTLSYTALHGAPLNQRELVEATIEAEIEAHGRPSGIDPNISVHGGVIAYRPGHEPVRITVGRELSEYKLVVADSGLKRNTKTAVEFVLDLAARYSDVLDHLYKAANELSKRAITALERGDATTLGELMNINHGLLAAIGVSTPELEDLVYTARRAGALGSKITGAGLGGAIIALVHKDKTPIVVQELRNRAPWTSPVKLGESGVLVES
ncbi:MAG: mevalonate kinase [Desulfurococcales archaeon]|nr:mevalonate kinase [Desulfurococcales archaeon]